MDHSESIICANLILDVWEPWGPWAKRNVIGSWDQLNQQDNLKATNLWHETAETVKLWQIMVITTVNHTLFTCVSWSLNIIILKWTNWLPGRLWAPHNSHFKLPNSYKPPHILPCLHENKQNLACSQLVWVFITKSATILRLMLTCLLYLIYFNPCSFTTLQDAKRISIKRNLSRVVKLSHTLHDKGNKPNPLCSLHKEFFAIRNSASKIVSNNVCLLCLLQ